MQHSCESDGGRGERDGGGDEEVTRNADGSHG